MNGLLLTLLLGLFIIVGAIIVFITKNNDKFIEFSISLAFGVMVTLIFIDIIPEVFEVIDLGGTWKNLLAILGGGLLGFLLLTLLDRFIPDHDDDHTTHKDDDRNLKHIGLVSSIALIIHNIVEGMAIYSLFISDSTAGVMASIGVGLHNIPLGMVIASTFYQGNKSIKKTFLIIIGIALSTFIGGLVIYLFNVDSIMEIIEGISLTVTLGMLIYISIRELLPKIIHSEYKKITISGIVLGVGLLLITLLF